MPMSQKHFDWLTIFLSIQVVTDQLTKGQIIQQLKSKAEKSFLSFSRFNFWGVHVYLKYRKLLILKILF